jgi:cleavage and polyadenylation specificity factor subunit 3
VSVRRDRSLIAVVQHILLEPTEITTLSGRTVPLFMSVQYISFSAHTDFLQTSGFIDILKPPHVILVHGDKNEMHRLKTSLQSRYEGQNIKILSPKNCQTVVLPFQGERTAKIMGEIVKDVSSPEQLHGYQVHGLMVTKDFHHHIVDPTDLHTYTHMHIASLIQKQRVPFTLSTTVLVRALHQMFDNVLQVTYKGKSRAHCINDIIFVVPKLVATSKKIKADPAAMEVDEQELDPDAPLDHVTLVWTSNEVADLLADGIVALLLHLQSSPSTPSPSKTSDATTGPAAYQRLLSFLALHFPVVRGADGGEEGPISLALDAQSTHATVHWPDLRIETSDEALRSHIGALLGYIAAVLFPLRDENKPISSSSLLINNPEK